MFLKKRNVISIGILAVLTIAACTALWLPQSPYQIHSGNRLLAPNAVNWFGTDHFGRDLFARVLIAGRVSLYIGFLVAALSTLIGSAVGLVSGYYRKADFLLMRLIDGMLAFPALLLALALVAALGGNITNIVIALTFAFSPIIARVVRSAVLQVSNVQYIEAAQTSGEGNVTILLRYILPNILSPLIVQATFVFARAILAEAALSFLGVGVNPSTPTWGNILQESKIYMTIAPWYSIFPGVAIILSVLSLNMLGDGLRDALDPHSLGNQRKHPSLLQRIFKRSAQKEHAKGAADHA